MPPAGLLAIIAVGLVLAYVLPQRIRERSDYALVRTEDRYSADMRVVRASAARITASETAREVASTSAELPLLVTGAARARVAALGNAHMSRPHGPLERAATHAQREHVQLRRDRLGSQQTRAVRARRRALASAATLVLTMLAWVLAATTGFPALLAALATGALVTVVGSSVRAGAAERAALRQVRGVVREVRAAATATQALRAVHAARARGDEAQPSDVATQAIRIVTSTDLAAGQAPALPSAEQIREAERAARATRAAQAAQAAVVDQELRAAEAHADAASSSWRPRTMPVPAYALKASVRQHTARPLSEADYAASSHADYRVVARGDASSAVAPGQAPAAGDPTPASGALDAILARRRQASA